MTRRSAARRARRHYTLEFKREAVALSERQQQEGRPLAAIAKDLGIVPQTLRYWQRVLAPDGAAPAPPRDVHALELEVRRLQRELDRVRQEREFLKKAAAFFAKDSP